MTGPDGGEGAQECAADSMTCGFNNPFIGLSLGRPVSRAGPGPT